LTKLDDNLPLVVIHAGHGCGHDHNYHVDQCRETTCSCDGTSHHRRSPRRRIRRLHLRCTVVDDDVVVAVTVVTVAAADGALQQQQQQRSHVLAAGRVRAAAARVDNQQVRPVFGQLQQQQDRVAPDVVGGSARRSMSVTADQTTVGTDTRGTDTIR